MIEPQGEFKPFGGQYIAETLAASIQEVQIGYEKYREEVEAQLKPLLKTFVGRETPLYFAKKLSEQLGGAKIYLKREDLCHTGAHKINNALGQALLAKLMGKDQIIAETGAGQHGVATASACAALGLKCRVYMGEVDYYRQLPNVQRMKLFGAEIIPVSSGQKTLKDAINEAMRDWSTNPNSYYLIGSALGPEPYPQIVRNFQAIIGQEAREQILDAEGKLPHTLIACVGGGSNAIGLFHAFLSDSCEMIGVEAGGKSTKLGEHAARFQEAEIGFFHGTKSYLLQDEDGQVVETHSISAGLDYPAVGPEHAKLFLDKRVRYSSARDDEALEAFQMLCKVEGIIPALESSHALAEAIKVAPTLSKEDILVVNLSGRGDKDMPIIEKELF
jgi:tryptophan synthase beta chain